MKTWKCKCGRGWRKYKVAIGKDGVMHQGGSYSTAEYAARVADRLALKLHGEFAVLNFPRTDYA